MKKVLFFLEVFLIVLIFTSCNTPQDLLDDYNSRFEKVPITAQDLFNGDNAHLMLKDAYEVGIESTLVLTAPFGCDTYAWQITASGKNTPYVLDPFKTDKREAHFYFPKIKVLYDEVLNSELKRVPYDIRLTVQKDGKNYSDTAVLILYSTD